MPSIECSGITVEFGARRVLNDLRLSVANGEWLTVAGPSGGGKSTLLRTIAGIVAPQGGSVVLGGETASAAGRILIPPHRRGVAFLFQEAALWPHLSARANVALGMAARSDLSRSGRRDLAAAALGRVGLAERAAAFPGELSGGEAQRVALARALVSAPRILLLDEPVAHLDLHLSGSLMREIRKLHAEENWITICVSHRPEPPARRKDRLVILERGRIQFDGDFGSVPNKSESACVSVLGEYLKTRFRDGFDMEEGEPGGRNE